MVLTGVAAVYPRGIEFLGTEFSKKVQNLENELAKETDELRKSELKEKLEKVKKDGIKVGKDNNWDCWKPILHDESTKPSNGIELYQLLTDNRVKSYDCLITLEGIKEIVVENRWDEKFLLKFYQNCEQFTAHATRV